MSFDSLLVESLVESPIGANETQNSTFVCSSCCALYTARIKLDPFGYNSIRFFSGVNLFVATITIIIATLLVGRQQKRRPDISTFQRKLMLFVIGLIVISMIGGILPITMASIVVAYGYHNAVPWPLWVRQELFRSRTNFFLAFANPMLLRFGQLPSSSLRS